MNLLAIDTCGELIGLAFSRQDRSTALIVPDSKNRHAELLLPALMDFLEKHNLKLADFSRLAITVGPGSFTGIRVGLGAAKGIHAASGIEMIGITTLELKAWMAAQNSSTKKIAVLDRFKKNKFLLQLFAQDMKELSEPMVLDESEITNTIPDEEILITGNYAEEFIGKSGRKNLLWAQTKMNSAEAMLSLAQHKTKTSLAFIAAEPFYIMEPDAKLPANKRP